MNKEKRRQLWNKKKKKRKSKQICLAQTKKETASYNTEPPTPQENNEDLEAVSRPSLAKLGRIRNAKGENTEVYY